MKKNSFIKGAFIATFAIFVSKFLGIVYVIPFYSIIGEQNGSLYGYAYTIYNLFLALSTVGIPPAMSKLISEYNTLGYYNTKERAYRLGKKLMLIISVVVFIILFTMAPIIAKAIIGDATGGNSIEDIAFVVRVISTAILVVPLLSISKGYLQGHKFIAPSSYSQILEQIIRIIVILVGSYTFLNVFKLGMTNAIGVAVFGATVGAIGALIYVLYKIHKNKSQLNIDEPIKAEEKKITNKEILKKIITYSLPFIMFGLTMSIYEFIDMVTIVKTLTHNLGFSTVDAESIIGVMNTWGNKLNSIVIAISIGLTTSLVPNITSSYVAKKYSDVKKKINQSLQILILVALPITIGLSILATPVFNAFYGENIWGPTVFKYSVFIAIATCLFNTTIIILQSLNKYKTVFISIISGIVIKYILNVPLMILTHNLGFQGFYGAITATLIGIAVSVFINLYVLHKDEELKVRYKQTLTTIIKVVYTLAIMCIVLLLMEFIIPIEGHGRMMSLLIVIIYGIVGAGIYFGISIKNHMIRDVVGDKFIDNIFDKIKKILHIKRQNNSV